MKYNSEQVVNIRDEKKFRQLRDIAPKVHAIAGIGNPQPFFTNLREAGIEVIEHAMTDHHIYSPSDIEFGDGLPVVMTEKDAVKCKRFASDNCWYLPLDAELPSEFGVRLLNLLEKRNG